MSEGYSKNWCQGFCRTCGTGCGQHEEEKYRLMKERDELKSEFETLKNHNEVQVGLANLYQKQRNDERERSEKLREALERIKDGGMPPGVLGDVTDRMLAMCEIAGGALLAAKQDEKKEKVTMKDPRNFWLVLIDETPEIAGSSNRHFRVEHGPVRKEDFGPGRALEIIHVREVIGSAKQDDGNG